MAKKSAPRIDYPVSPVGKIVTEAIIRHVRAFRAAQAAKKAA